MSQNPPVVEYHPHGVDIVDRPEGYRELRCLPATWSYPEARPLGPLLTEFYSSRTGVDPHGLGVYSEFWSGSDAALRLRALPADDLVVRELAALASRRSVGLNAPKPWVSRHELEEMADAWEPQATGVHFSQYVPEKETTSIWSHYGMDASIVEPVVFGYGMRKSERPELGRAGCVWAGGPGTWYAWSTLLGWDRWRRRQEAQPLATAAEPGKLLLFVSHRWESLDHPDPTGAQLLCLKVGLTLAVAAAVLQLGSAEKKVKTVSGLPELVAEFLDDVLGSVEATVLQPWAREVVAAAERAQEEEGFWTAAGDLETPEARPLLDRIRDRVLVWYDYASMFQAPRTPREETEFRREILELNAIQGHAGTLVIAGDEQYLSRAWCFFELCGGMRQRIVELTPSWGTKVGVGDSVTRWASRSDQLIGALNALGPEAIRRSGLEATHAEDLPVIALLLRELPLTALIETDDSDLIGGVLPIPFRSGEWIFATGDSELSTTCELALASTPDFGRLPPPEALRRMATRHAGADSLDGTVGMWVYTTQRVLTLAWAARAGELWEKLQTELAGVEDRGELGGLDDALQLEREPLEKEPSVACLWADSRSLADDGLGWTRAIPSAVGTLVIVTQVDLPELCPIYESVLRAHLACGVPVVTYAPETGRTLVHRPDDVRELGAEGRRTDVLAVPLLRRPDCRPSRMLTAAGVAREDVEVLAALRLDPAQGFVPPGRLCDEAAAEGMGSAGEEVTAAQLLGHSEARVRAEGLARSTAATWDEWCTPRVHQSAWQVGMAPLQVRIIEELVRKVSAVSDDPFERRKLLRILVEDHEGYALPPSILEDADAVIALILEGDEAAPG